VCGVDAVTEDSSGQHSWKTGNEMKLSGPVKFLYDLWRPSCFSCKRKIGRGGKGRRIQEEEEVRVGTETHRSWVGRKTDQYTSVYPNVSGRVRTKYYAYNNKHFLRSNIKGYGGKTH
jgi:hypothetical protein